MGSRRRRSARPFGPVLLIVAVVVGVASAVGAQVDPVSPTPTVWSASCVRSGATELVVYGKGWGPGAVALEVTDQEGDAVGGASVTAAERPGGAVLQARVPLTGPAPVRLTATQGATSAGQQLVASGSCSPTVTAVVNASCASSGRPVTITVTVRGAPTSAFDAVLHHADLYGPAEAVDRTQPRRPDGDYAFPLSVNNVPDRVVPVTLEAKRRDGSFAYATTNVGLPPSCSQPNSTTIGPPGTATPGTTQPPVATTAAPPTVGPIVPLRPSSAVPNVGGGPVSVALSPAVARAGETTTVSGRGFTPSARVTLRWRPGIGEWTVTAGGDGTFRTQVLVLPNDVEGPRVLEASPGGAAPARFLVVPGSDQPAFGGVFLSG